MAKDKSRGKDKGKVKKKKAQTQAKKQPKTPRFGTLYDRPTNVTAAPAPSNAPGPIAPTGG